MKIKEIYENLEKQDETVLFQVKRRSILNIMLREFEEIFKDYGDYVYWNKYKEIPLNKIYLCVGKWRLGMAGILAENKKDKDGEYCFDHICIDWKCNEYWVEKQKNAVNKIIETMDKYRTDIKISKKRYEDFEEKVSD